MRTIHKYPSLRNFLKTVRKLKSTLLKESYSVHEKSRTILQEEHAVNKTLFQLRCNIKELSLTLPGLYQKNHQRTIGMSMDHMNTTSAYLLIYFAVYFMKLSHSE